MSQLNRIVLIIAMNVLVYVLAVERYTDEFDNVDIGAIIRNDTLRDEYHKCYMNTAPCTSRVQKEITEMFREALITNCEKCNENQRELLKKVIQWYAKNQIEILLQKIAKSGEVMMQKNANQ